MTQVEILMNVNGWLKHAETKHAVLVGLTAAGATTLCSNLNSIFSLGMVAKIWSVVSLMLIVAAVITSLISFIPALRSPKPFSSAKNGTTPNPYFFSHIANMSISELNSLLLPMNSTPLPADEWIADQIIANSRIAMRKYAMFRISVWLVLFAVAAPVAVVFGIFRLTRRKAKHD